MNELDLRIEARLLVGRQILPRGVLLLSAGQVQWAGPAEQAPASAARELLAVPELLVAPGFVDLHVHGGGGGDACDGTSAALEQLARTHAGHGTTALCTSILAGGPQGTLRALEAVRQQQAVGPAGGGARILGAHLEGPFLNPTRGGAQPRQHLRAPDLALLEELLAAGGPALRIMTLAPELPGALRLVERLVEGGVIVALGHSEATYAEALAAIEAGARLGTHTFNAMRGLHHREPGLTGAILTAPQLVAEAIADNHHLAPAVLSLLWRLKGPAGLALVTDCTAALECAPAAARLGQQPVTVRGGAVRLPDGTLAGSLLTMERALANLVGAGAPLVEALQAASATPARLLGCSASLAAGASADLVLLDDALAVQAVYVAGRRVAARGAC